MKWELTEAERVLVERTVQAVMPDQELTVAELRQFVAVAGVSKLTAAHGLRMRRSFGGQVPPDDDGGGSEVGRVPVRLL